MNSQRVFLNLQRDKLEFTKRSIRQKWVGTMKEKEKEAMHIKKNDTIGNDIYEIFSFYVLGFVVNFGM